MIISSLLAILLLKIAEVTALLHLKKYLPLKWQQYLNVHLYWYKAKKSKVDFIAKYSDQLFYNLHLVIVKFKKVKVARVFALKNFTFYHNNWLRKNPYITNYPTPLTQVYFRLSIQNNKFYPLKIAPKIRKNTTVFTTYKINIKI